MVAGERLVDVRHDFDALAHDEHDDDADEDEGHVLLLALGLQALAGPMVVGHRLLQFHRGVDPAKNVALQSSGVEMKINSTLKSKKRPYQRSSIRP